MTEPRVGPFILRQQVDSGADEALWLAERVGRERRPRWAAVRVPTTSRGAAADRIAVEYGVLRELDDPRLPRVLGHFPGVGALAVAWVPGASLQTAWEAHRRGLLTLHAATVLALGQDLAEALRHIHSRRDADGQPLVHGRLAASHLRISRHGRVALLGAGRPDADPGLNALSPECLGGGAITPPTDQWALGALLVEMLGGERLYAGLSQRERLEGQVAPWVDPIAAVNPEVGRLLTRLLARDAAARFTDEGELVAALAHARRGLGGVADLRALGEALAELDPGVIQSAPAPTLARPGHDAVPDPADAWPVEPRLAPVVPAPDATSIPPSPVNLAPPPAPVADPPPAADTGAASPTPPADTAPPAPPPDVADADHTALEPTEPLGPGHDQPLRPPLRRPATARRLGLGELAALAAVGLLIASVIYLALVRA